MKWYRTVARYSSTCSMCAYPIEPGQEIAFKKDTDPNRPTLRKHVQCPRDKALELANAQITLRALGFDGGRRS